jgi:hypothetical protein
MKKISELFDEYSDLKMTITDWVIDFCAKFEDLQLRNPDYETYHAIDTSNRYVLHEESPNITRGQNGWVIEASSPVPYEDYDDYCSVYILDHWLDMAVEDVYAEVAEEGRLKRLKDEESILENLKREAAFIGYKVIPVEATEEVDVMKEING